MSDQFLEQWNDINFYVKLGKNTSDTFAMLSEAYAGEARRKSHVFEWHKWFKEDVCKLQGISWRVEWLTTSRYILHHGVGCSLFSNYIFTSDVFLLCQLVWYTFILKRIIIVGLRLCLQK